MYYYNLQVGNRVGKYTYKSIQKLSLSEIVVVSFNKVIELGLILEQVSVNELTIPESKILEIIESTNEIVLEQKMKLIKFISNYYIAPPHIVYPTFLNLNYKKYLKINEEKKTRNTKVKYKEQKPVVLNSDQKDAVNKILSSNKHVLLHGVTGSGKTEVYIELTKKILEKGQNVILLVPEITLTPQIVERFQSVFKDLVGVYHSKIDSNKKIKLHKKIKNGDIKIIIGTRSALLTDLSNIGLIIIDEEHERSYKQEQKLPYNAKIVALKKAQIENIKILFGSATPSFETLYLIDQNLIEKVDLDSRYNNQSMPNIEIRNVNVFNDPITDQLLKDISNRIKKDEQVLVLYNRKSYALFQKCNSCMHVQMCPNCDMALSYVKKDNVMRCAHCEFKKTPLKLCPECGNALSFHGYGTEKIEEMLTSHFGDDILRMDKDVVYTDNQIKKAYESFLNKQKHILVGTQMIAKGFHFPDVTLVVVLNLDQIESNTSFNSSERAYQLVTQAAGRAGRGDKKGEVILQSNANNSLALEIQKQDYNAFYKSQMQLREILFYPPISKAIGITVFNKKEEVARQELEQIIKYINKNVNQRDDVSVGNIDSSYSTRKQKMYEKTIIIYCSRDSVSIVRKVLKAIIAQENKFKSKIYIDVDPERS